MVECLFDVKLEEKSRFFSSVKPSRIVVDKHEVVMNAPRLDESALGVGNNVIHARGQTAGEDFGHDLCKTMDEANWSKVGDFLRPIFLWKKENVGGVKPMQVVGVEIGESLYNRHDVKFNNIPTSLEEFATEPIRPGSLIGRHVPNGILHLILRKRIIQPVQVRSWEVNGLPIEGSGARSWPTISRGEVILGDSLLVIMGGSPTVVTP
jgi:hypothetical protein